MSVNLITEEDKDTLLAQRQQTIEALLQYIASILDKRGAEEIANSLRAFSDHVAQGGDLKVQRIHVHQAQRARELMDFFKVDYIPLAAETEENGDYITLLTRSDQEESVDKAMEVLEFEKNTHLVWIGIEDFLRLNIGNTLGRITIERGQVTALSQVLDDTGLMFSVNFLADERADVYFHEYDRDQMRECIDCVYKTLGIERAIDVSRVSIDSAYTAERIAQDKERDEHTHQNTHKHHAFSLSH